MEQKENFNNFIVPDTVFQGG